MKLSRIEIVSEDTIITAAQREGGDPVNLVFQNAKDDVGGVSWAGISGVPGAQIGVEMSVVSLLPHNLLLLLVNSRPVQ